MKKWLDTMGWRLLPGFLAAGLMLVTAPTEIVQTLERSVYRSLFQIRGERPWDDRVALIEIDEASLTTIGQFPWPRQYYSQLLEQLIPAEPRVIAFDILFAESGEDDTDLAVAIARHGNVVLATAWDTAWGVIGPNATLVDGAIATGHIHHDADVDGITRTYQPKINGTLALSLTAVQRYYSQQLSPFTTDLHQTLWLNWPGPVQNAPRYSFVDVLEGEVPTAELTDKIIFIGFTGAGLDSMITPYNRNPPAAGVYQHVVAANNLLAQNHLQPAVLPVWALFVLLNPLLGYGLFGKRPGTQLLSSVLIAVTWGGVVIFAFYQNYWLPTTVPIVGITSTGLFVSLAKRLQLKTTTRKPAEKTGNLPLVHYLAPRKPLKSQLSSQEY